MRRSADCPRIPEESLRQVFEKSLWRKDFDMIRGKIGQAKRFRELIELLLGIDRSVFLAVGIASQRAASPWGYDGNLGKVQEMTEQLMDGGERT